MEDFRSSFYFGLFNKKGGKMKKISENQLIKIMEAFNFKEKEIKNTILHEFYIASIEKRDFSLDKIEKTVSKPVSVKERLNLISLLSKLEEGKLDEKFKITKKLY